MPVPRYEREIDELAGPRFTRLFFVALGIAALIGLGVGVIWVIAGISAVGIVAALALIRDDEPVGQPVLAAD